MRATEILFDNERLSRRFSSAYQHMRQRAKTKKWKKGRRKGHIRVLGLEKLPFTRDQLFTHAYKLIGPGVVQCPYCVEIGRPARLIDLTNCVLDHKEPLARVGLLCWKLENIVPVCADCNNCKGSMSYDLFIALMREMEHWPDQFDRNYLSMCLRSHGVTQRLRYAPKGTALPAGAAEDSSPESMDLEFVDPF